MTGSNLTRLARLLGSLAKHPRHIAPYLRHGPFTSKTPLDLELPWFSWAAIEFLDRHVTGSMRVFEYGSGGSTLYFARRAKSVTSTEDHQAWLERVKSRLAANSVSNVELQHRPFDFHSAQGFEQSEYLNSIPDQRFDILIVDGTEEAVPVRPICFQHAEKRVPEGGIIIVDDSWRYPELRAQSRAKEWREFRSTGPSRPGVTSTDIFFY